MIVATRSSPHQNTDDQGDILTIYRDRTWSQFKHLQQGFENVRGIRLSFHRGTIEILMPGKAHELFKSIIGILIETFLLDRGIEFTPTGSATQELADIVALEADESYEIEDLRLAVEVNFTSGDVSKLERYQILGVNEVWLWEDGVLDVYQLGNDGYIQVFRSSIPALAALDLSVLTECIAVGETSRVDAVQRLRAAHPV
jgi:Uma2 family endonuclease